MLKNVTELFEKKLVKLDDQRQKTITSKLVSTLERYFTTCASQVNMMLTKKQQLQLKTKQLQIADLQRRQQLDKKLKQRQEVHDKRRMIEMNKRVQQQKIKMDHVKEIFYKHEERENQERKKEKGLFQEHQKDMEGYWDRRAIKTAEKYRAQSEVKPVYQDAIARKKHIQNAQDQRSYLVRELHCKDSLKRRIMVNQLPKKKQQVHDLHNNKIEATLVKNTILMQARRNRIIDYIGQHFAASEDQLRRIHTVEEKRWENRRIDEEERVGKTLLNLSQRFVSKMLALEGCHCHKTFLEDQNISKLCIDQETLRHCVFSHVVKDLAKKETFMSTRSSQFFGRKSQLHKSVLSNKDIMRLQKEQKDAHELRMWKQHAESLRLKKQMEDETNCTIRQIRAN